MFIFSKEHWFSGLLIQVTHLLISVTLIYTILLIKDKIKKM